MTGMHTTVIALDFVKKSMTHEDIKTLWAIEHMINALPTTTRLHIDLEEEPS